ncbi:MAG: GDYXXLXY domain-containing protein [Janthinobacterium lividum]
MANAAAAVSEAPPRFGLLPRLLVGAQVLYVLGVAGAGYATTALGKAVVLAATPDDLTTLKTTDFVRLRYAVATVPRAQWRGPDAPRTRQNVYVLLATAGAPATVLGVFGQEPAAAGQAVLRGWVTDVFPHTLGLRYGLERYYVPAASILRKSTVARPLRVQVRIAPWGQARIVEVSE